MSRRTREILREGVLHVARHPLRSALSATTCAVAIAVTVNVISLAYGLDEDVRRDVSRFGTNTIDVVRLPALVPGARRERLGPEQLALVRERLRGLDAVTAPRRQAIGRAAGDAEVPAIPVFSVSPDYLRTLQVGVLAGRWLEPGDDPATTCVLDHSAARSLFPGRDAEDAVGRTVRVAVSGDERERRVLGVLEDPLTYRELFEAFDEGRGSRTLTSALLSFRNVYVPEGALAGEEYGGVSIALPDRASADEAARRLREVWPETPEGGAPATNLGVFVRHEWMESVGVSSSTGALLGNLVWLIVVGVAVVMISTLNLIVVRERYDEIAVRRCEGARRRDVALQVTAEGTLVALAGGIAGLPLGYVGAIVLRAIVGFPFRFEAPYAAVATLVAVAIGLVASVLPARHAAGLQPASVLTRRQT
jgi:putative ABC transport system permease protein